MGHESQEMYIRAIYELKEARKPAKVTEIAKILKIAPASVTEMLDKLVAAGLVVHKRYGDIELTKAGQQVAIRMVRKCRLLEVFFHDYLGLTNPRMQACLMEHVLSDESEHNLCIKLKHPKISPSGKPIPPCPVCNCRENTIKVWRKVYPKANNPAGSRKISK